MMQALSKPPSIAAIALMVLSLCAASSVVASASAAEESQRKPKAHAIGPSRLDRSGSQQVGKASFYSRKFAGRKMADGLRPKQGVAAVEVNPIAVPLPNGRVKLGTGAKDGRQAQ